MIVGNVGCAHRGRNRRKALKIYHEYRRQSKTGYGRSAGEQVTLTRDAEPIREYFPPTATHKTSDIYKPGYMQMRGAS